MALYSVVPCWEEFGQQSEDWDLESTECAVRLMCDWGHRHMLVDDLLGNQRPWPHGGFFNPPIATRAKISPFVTTSQMADNQAIVYDYAMVDVEYSHEGQDLLTETLEPTADFITMDWRRFRWSSPTGEMLSREEAPGKLRRGLNLSRTLFRVPSPLPSILLSGVGGVNNVPYTSSLLGLTFSAETLLYIPPNLNRSLRTDGTKGWTLAVKFGYKPEGWNRFWRSSTQSYEYMYVAGAAPGSPPYRNFPLTNFSSLLQ